MLLLEAVALLISGCVTMTDPVPMGEGRYMISLNARGGFQNNGELLAQSIKRANDFCTVQGLHADVLSTQTSGVQMWTPQDNQVVFRCVSESH
jgi:hypothetical protein